MSVLEAKSEAEDLRSQLISTTVELMLDRGYNDTSLEDICKATGSTKGAVYHHFKNKEELAKAALRDYFDARMNAVMQVEEMGITDPYEKLHAYIDVAIGISREENALRGCLLGNLTQEVHQSHPELNSECHVHFIEWQSFVEQALTEAKKARKIKARWNPSAVAQHFIALFQGSIILSKAAGDNLLFEENMREFQRYLDTLFDISDKKRKR